MHAYLATICREAGAELVHVCGVTDHVHLVTTLPRTLSQAEIDPRYRGFFWQRGYGAFSVSPSQLEAVLQYIETEPDHHRTRTFQEEYRELLRRHGIDFDERHVWD